MKTTMMAILAAGAIATTYGALQAQGIALVDDQMGLSRTSVFDDPSPDVFQYPQTDPAAAHALPRSWDSAPPQVPHKTESFLPITSGKNRCVACHEQPDRVGKAKIKGDATPMSEGHYVKQSDGSLKRSDAHYVCVQCHSPQADVKDLVGNTFKP